MHKFIRWLGRRLINLGLHCLHFGNKDLQKKRKRGIITGKGYTWRNARFIDASSSKRQSTSTEDSVLAAENRE